MINYSQSTEQEYILSFFGKYRPRFLEIGSNDGITYSNTYALTELGSVGTCVDASPKAFKRLLETHRGKHIQCIHSAVGSYNGSIKFYESGELVGQGDVALVSSANPEELKRWASLNIDFEEIEVPVVDFKTLYDICEWKIYEFISLDVESMEMEILPQIDFDQLNTQLVCVEFNGKFIDEFESIMKPWGFEILHTNAENLIFCR